MSDIPEPWASLSWHLPPNHQAWWMQRLSDTTRTLHLTKPQIHELLQSLDRLSGSHPALAGVCITALPPISIVPDGHHDAEPWQDAEDAPPLRRLPVQPGFDAPAPPPRRLRRGLRGALGGLLSRRGHRLARTHGPGALCGCETGRVGPGPCWLSRPVGGLSA